MSEHSNVLYYFEVARKLLPSRIVESLSPTPTDDLQLLDDRHIQRLLSVAPTQTFSLMFYEHYEEDIMTMSAVEVGSSPDGGRQMSRGDSTSFETQSVATTTTTTTNPWLLPEPKNFTMKIRVRLQCEYDAESFADHVWTDTIVFPAPGSGKDPFLLAPFSILPVRGHVAPQTVIKRIPRKYLLNYDSCSQHNTVHAAPLCYDFYTTGSCPRKELCSECHVILLPVFVRRSNSRSDDVALLIPEEDLAPTEGRRHAWHAMLTGGTDKFGTQVKGRTLCLMQKHGKCQLGEKCKFIHLLKKPAVPYDVMPLINRTSLQICRSGMRCQERCSRIHVDGKYETCTATPLCRRNDCDKNHDFSAFSVSSMEKFIKRLKSITGRPSNVEDLMTTAAKKGMKGVAPLMFVGIFAALEDFMVSFREEAVDAVLSEYNRFESWTLNDFESTSLLVVKDLFHAYVDQLKPMDAMKLGSSSSSSPRWRDMIATVCRQFKAKVSSQPMVYDTLFVGGDGSSRKGLLHYLFTEIFQTDLRDLPDQKWNVSSAMKCEDPKCCCDFCVKGMNLKQASLMMGVLYAVRCVAGHGTRDHIVVRTITDEISSAASGSILPPRLHRYATGVLRKIQSHLGDDDLDGGLDWRDVWYASVLSTNIAQIVVRQFCSVCNARRLAPLGGEEYMRVFAWHPSFEKMCTSQIDDGAGKGEPDLGIASIF
eukprot:PhF_6_TR39726/c0_g1_i1/m.59156